MIYSWKKFFIATTISDTIATTSLKPLCHSLRIFSIHNKFVQNTTGDDSSIVYGTQKNEGPSEFRQPPLPPQRLETNRRNLSLEFLSEDSLLNSESGSTSIYEQETQAIQLSAKDGSSGIHDLETQKFTSNQTEISNLSNQKCTEKSNEIFEADTQQVLLGSESGNFEESKIYEANTPALPVKLGWKTGNSNSAMDDKGICEESFSKDFKKFDKIHEEATQAFSIGGPVPSTKVNECFSKIDNSGVDDEVIFKVSTQKVPTKSDEISGEITHVFQSKNPIQSEEFDKVNDSDIDDEGVFKKESHEVPTKVGNTHEDTMQALSKSNQKIMDSDTDEEGIFKEATQRVTLKSDKIHEEATQVFPYKSMITAENLGEASRIEDSDTDEEGIFQGPTQKYAAFSPKKIFEEPTQAVLIKIKGFNKESQVSDKADSNIANDSDTDEEGYFEKPTQKYTLKSNSKSNLKSKSVISAKADSNIGEDSETDDEGIFDGPTQKYSLKSTEKIYEAVTQVVDIPARKSNTKSETSIFETADSNIADDSGTDNDRIFNRSTQKVPLMDNKVKTSPKSKSKSEIHSKVSEDSETGEENIFQKKEDSNTCKTLKQKRISKTPTRKQKISKSVPESEITEKVDLKAFEDSETEDEGFFNKKDDANTSKILEQKEISKTPTRKQTISESAPKSEISAKVNLNESEDSETDDEGIFQRKEDSNASKTHKKKEISKTPSQKRRISKSVPKSKISPKVDLKASEDSETDNEGTSQKKEESNTNKTLEQKKVSVSPIQKQKISPKPSTTGQHSSETDDEGIFESKSANKRRKQKHKIEVDDLASTQLLSVPPLQGRETSPQTNEKEKLVEENQIDDMAPTQRLSAPSPPTRERTISLSDKENEQEIENEVDDMAPTQRMSVPSPDPRESIGVKNASIEDFDYEMASTQPLEDNKTVEVKTPENKTKSRGKIISKTPKSSGSKKNSGKRNSKNKSNSKLDDTIEENLNQMFEGETEVVKEPTQMLTQQLENILEQSQVLPEELLQTPSTSRTRISRRIETSPEKTSPSISKRSSRSRNSSQVCKFNLKLKSKPEPSSGFQVSVSKIETKTCKSSDDSDDDFVSILPKQKVLNLGGSLDLKGGLKFRQRSPSSSTSSEFSFYEAPQKSSPSLTKSKSRKAPSKRIRNGGKKSNLSLSPNIENFRIHEEVEKYTRSKGLKMDSDGDSDLEELQRIASKVINTKSVYAKKWSANESQITKILVEKSKVVESSSVLQVDVENLSPRMPQLNIIRSKKGATLKAESSDKRFEMMTENEKVNKGKVNIVKVANLDKKEQKVEEKAPLKKRVLKSNDEGPDTSSESKRKRLKVGEINEELEITTFLARRSEPFDKSRNIDEKAETSIAVPVAKPQRKNAPEKKTVLKNPPTTRLKVTSESSSNNDSLEGSAPKNKGRLRKKKADEPKVDSTINRRTSKRTASSSLSSLVDNSAVSDSGDIPSSTSGSLKAPSKAKRARNHKVVVKDNDESSNKSEASQTLRTSKRKASQNKEIISNSSSSSSLVESSCNEAKTSMSEKPKKIEPRKTATRKRKTKEVSDTESAMADVSSASSSMVSLNEISVDGNSSVASIPSRSRRNLTLSPLKHKVLFTGVSASDYQKSLKKLGKSMFIIN